ncbi:MULTISPECIES: three component ABC system middle component [Mesorhizobium]|uniref:three component ABC system middle component n=1 Tax=Mesorhizobium sp. TaxID=1871066 RepID=UPI000494BEAD|nr:MULTISPECIES: three component ABC system middle component [Mesorhizobium]RWB26979.1 MAG: hypothetical protein EOQ43_28805 [Mesorhizobium sp.]RWE65476.1 MAG: hypothetical protein EOS62_24850 [Mesorhizobium sp.]RWH69652.1 MAG: hypothetical protein EOQ85_32370 [Mesorhizobium sp.]RWH76315.1 MAG: hypothetical protein EOQ86_30955 [Mesorhizobium sp.]RWH83883.1 MAG: hypothetical protein EOQ87_32005 [Mesorhizobium sp.]
MNIAYDLFAETNPAFGTFGLLGFCRKYVAASRGKPPTLALAYLALPIALSDDLETSFLETAATTGLLSWLNRYPDVRLDLSVRLDASKEIVSAAVRFGLCSRALALGNAGTIEPGPRAPSTTPVDNLPENPKRAIKRAERLGSWMGKAGSAGSVFSAFGVTP